MRIDVITMFPDVVTHGVAASLLGKAIEEGVLDVKIHDLRGWGEGPHRRLDDLPYGGGAGMVMKPGPVVEAIESVLEPGGRVILLAAAGKALDQPLVTALSKESQIVLVCGRYEGMDDRIRQFLGAEEISIGPYVLSGGEAPALVVIEAVARLIPGVLGNAGSLVEESFSDGDLLEYPHYTRPPVFRGLEVPEVLLSGNHALIEGFRREEAVARTHRNRPAESA